MAIPTSPFDAAESIYAGLSVIAFTPEGGSQIVFEASKIDHKASQEEISIERPDANGTLRAVRTIVKKEDESLEFILDEAKRVIDIFGNALTGRKTGVATIYIPDPDDDTGKISLRSETGFACQVTRGSDMSFGGGEFTKPTIKIKSLKSGAITFTKDGSNSS